MKEYAYFPGCSLEKMASSYHQSAMETTKKLGIKLKELEDWNCCGATTYFFIDELLAYTLCARNLAIAEKTGLDVVAPCSACYKNMYFTAAHLKKDPDLAEHVNFALEEDNLHFNGNVNIKHLIEVFANDISTEEIQSKVSRPLEGIRVAPYYGCQIVRPQKEKENVEQPQFFEKILSAIGATPVNYPLKMRCCGGSLILSSRTAALSMVRNLLQCAVDSQATVIATACPMCQVNLEVYQQQVNLEFGTNFSFPVMYFTQLIGLAFGIKPKKLGIGKEFVSFAPSLLPVLQE
ncbi:MAG TPA: CoB--CoM heterodisulfide reductase iron-sulfur subunit B family protein [Anaerolineales bacterium]